MVIIAAFCNLVNAARDATHRSIYAYSLGGSRAVDSAPLSKPKSTTILSSIQLDGTLRYTTFSGGTTVERFKPYLETDLLPHLNGNSVLIMYTVPVLLPN